MTETEKVPEPTDTGIKGEQEAGSVDIDVTKQSPLSELPLARRIEGLASTHSRSLGGEVTAALIAGATTQIAHDYGEVKEELVRTREKIESTQAQLSECREVKAVLEERVRAERGSRHIRNVGIAIGTALLGFAIELLRNNFNTGALISTGFGLLLLFLGWFTGPVGVRK